LDEAELEGTLVLEKLAGIGQLDAFYEAVDADDLGRVRALMKRAEIDAETIAIVLAKIEAGD
jgi:hypothetical protein